MHVLIYSQALLCTYFFFPSRDLGLHKLVFMNDILPEGTEVGYYVCGKVCNVMVDLFLFNLSHLYLSWPFLTSFFMMTRGYLRVI